LLSSVFLLRKRRNVARTFHRRTYSGELGETAMLSPNLLNNLQLQFQLTSPITEFAPVIYSTQLVVPSPRAAPSAPGTASTTRRSSTTHSLLLPPLWAKKTTCDKGIHPIREHLRLVCFHFACKCIGDEVNHVLPRDHAGPWLGARSSREISSEGTVVFARKEKQLHHSDRPFDASAARYVAGFGRLLTVLTVLEGVKPPKQPAVLIGCRFDASP
jgi:hypothetical protein